MDKYVVFRRTVANELLQKGFKLKSIDEDYNNKKRCVFMFEPTQELIEYMEQLKKRIKENKMK